MKILIILIIITTFTFTANAVNHTFNYQGELIDAGTPANGEYDISISAYDNISGGTLVGNTSVHHSVMVSDGLFTIEAVSLGNHIYDGLDLWLEISIKKPTDSIYTVLTPLQKITSVPYATTLIDKGAVEGQVLTFDNTDGWKPANAPTGSDNQNITSLTLSGTTLSIDIEDGIGQNVDLTSLQDGTGTDNQNIGQLSLTGTVLKVGIESGSSQTIDLASLQDGTGTDSQGLSLTGTTLDITGGTSVSFAGWDTDASDDVVSLNDLSDAKTLSNNVFVGNNSGMLIMPFEGTDNTALGSNTLSNVLDGSSNTAIGSGALFSNNSTNNTAIGSASFLNNTGQNNTGLGQLTGFLNISGSNNVFIGRAAGYFETGSDKLYIENSESATPLIGGDFSTDEVVINGDLEITGKVTAAVSGATDMKAYMYGSIRGDTGAIHNFRSSDGFSASKQGPGIYRVDFDSAIGFNYVVNASSVEDMPYFTSVARYHTHMIIYVWDLTGANVDSLVNFILFKK